MSNVKHGFFRQMTQCQLKLKDFRIKFDILSFDEKKILKVLLRFRKFKIHEKNFNHFFF